MYPGYLSFFRKFCSRFQSLQKHFSHQNLYKLNLDHAVWPTCTLKSFNTQVVKLCPPLDFWRNNFIKFYKPYFLVSSLCIRKFVIKSKLDDSCENYIIQLFCHLHKLSWRMYPLTESLWHPAEAQHPKVQLHVEAHSTTRRIWIYTKCVLLRNNIFPLVIL